jgi:sugar/nucleoside kinase (ribokinase family)
MVLVCVGDLLVDVVARHHRPIRIGTDTASHITLRVAGSAANVAAAGADLRIASRLVTAVGDDELGRLAVAALQHRGVDVTAEVVGTPTGCIVVLVDAAGERTMLTQRGAAADLGDLPRRWDDDMAMLHVPMYGFAGGSTAVTVRRAIELAHARHVPVSIDASSTQLIDDLGVDITQRLIAEMKPNILFANADEAALLDLGGRFQPPTSQVVIKRGADAATRSRHDRRGRRIRRRISGCCDARISTGRGVAAGPRQRGGVAQPSVVVTSIGLARSRCTGQASATLAMR